MSNSKTRILLVEDETDIGRIIQLAMTELGLPYTLDIAISAEEGIELWESEPYDLLLTDYNLRGSTGLDLIEFVRASGHEIPTVLFTAYDSQALRRQARDLGVTVYLSKPFFMDQLVDTVRNLLPHKMEELGGQTNRRLA
jgi:two-component system, OmpR family, response regulator